MLTYDFAPLYRSTVGFDRLFDALDKQLGLDTNAPSYPPYDIERVGENAYRISIAVAGFAEDELTVETRENVLTVRGAKKAATQDSAKRETLYQGIAGRAFERRFSLADHVVVTGASNENGLLHIELKREVPEAQKPRTIAIGKPVHAAPKAVEKQAA